MSAGRVITLSGGVGGAKLVLGLSQTSAADRQVVVANTGDDFEHFGLKICPDIDTLLYTLSGLSDQQRGWGRADETWTFMKAMGAFGGQDWFNLGDGDMALHVLRSHRLKQGTGLSEFTSDIAAKMGIETEILPMTDHPVATQVETLNGPLAFQHYFVRDRCEPVATGFQFDGIALAQPNPVLVQHLQQKPAAIIIAPSNPYVSVDPILKLPGMRSLLKVCGAPIVAVSPIIGGKAIKGPAAKMMQELGFEVSALGVARHYRGLIDGIVIDQQDADLADDISSLGMKVMCTETIMNDLSTRIQLAENCLSFANTLRTGAIC